MNLNKTSCIILLLFIPSMIFNQDWKKALKEKVKTETNKIEKKVKEEIQPLTLDFKISKIGYNPLKSINKLYLTIDFNGHNPNSLGVTFNETEFDLFVNEKIISKFYNEKKINIPKNDHFSFQENAEIKILEAGKAIFNSILKKNAIYSVIGKYHVKTPLGNFSFAIKLIEKEINTENKKDEEK